MIKHIVSWKLKATDDAEKAEAFATIASSLTALVPVIKQIRSLTVGRNVANPGSNWDLALVAHYDSLAALKAYQEHPEHQRVSAIIAELVSDKAAVDFELE